MRKRRVMVLLDFRLVPPEDLTEESDARVEKFRTEFDVKTALEALGHSVRMVGVYDDLTPIRETIEEWKPHIAFNLMEDFAGNSALDYYIVSYLDMVGVPYTGCNPRGLILARDKSLSKKILSYHRIKVPEFRVFPYGKKIKARSVSRLPYPMIIKSLIEQGSWGIAQASYVMNEPELIDRVARLHDITKGDAIAEQYIAGRELYAGVIGNSRLQVLPLRELIFGNVDETMPRMATYKVKWDADYRQRWGIDYQFARPLSAGTVEKVARLCKRIYRVLDMSGYARMDLRLTPEGKVYVLEANPNAAIASNEDLALAAEKAGIGYEQLIKRILSLGLRRY